MYKPLINTVLVEIVIDEWAPATKTESEGMLGRSYREGKVVSLGLIRSTKDYPFEEGSEDHGRLLDVVESTLGREIMFNEGVESGTVFEDDGKTYGFIYWWDIRGVKK